MGRSGTPEEVANVAVWPSPDGTSYITGQALAVDSGQAA
ncbi:MAG: SDR family oxidoreductase [Anaerolineae bacterium]